MKKNNELLASAKITSKGQITIPKIVRDTLKIEEGDSIFFYIDEKENIKIANRKDCKVELEKNTEQIVVERGNENE